MASDGAPIALAHSQRRNGIAIPSPAIRPRDWPGSFPARFATASRANRIVPSGVGNRYGMCTRSRTFPRKSTSTRSPLRRPIFSPRKYAPFLASRMGVLGWPTFPRTGSPRLISSSFSRPRMITETVCAERPLIRAISAFAVGPWLLRSVRTIRSLWARSPRWLEPRTDSRGS